MSKVKLNVKSIEFKNFLSYGDYVTKLGINGSGPILILGDVKCGEPNRSNGAGKSSLLSAFIWCLFGRTINNSNPGDKIINWFSKKDCYVKITTNDGWEIIRTRNCDRHSELILKHNGVDVTCSTNTSMQAKLNEIFDLDFNIFISSVFGGQFGKSFLEMTAVKRKEVIEKMLGLDRLNHFSDIAKKKFKSIENNQVIVRTKIDSTLSNINKCENFIADNVRKSNEFENKKRDDIKEINDLINKYVDKMNKVDVDHLLELKDKWKLINNILSKVKDYDNEIKLLKSKLKSLNNQLAKLSSDDEQKLYDVPDIDELREEHNKINNIKVKLSNISLERDDIRVKLASLKNDLKSKIEIISHWKSKENSNCESCGQLIGKDHIDKTTSSLEKEIDILNDEISSLIKKYESINKIVDKCNDAINRPIMSIEEAERLINLNNRIIKKKESIVKERLAVLVDKYNVISNILKFEHISKCAHDKINNNRPSISLDEINNLLNSVDKFKIRIESLQDKLESITNSINPYLEIINNSKDELNSLNNELSNLNSKIDELDNLFKHYKYIYNSYHDRRKIKKWLLSELVPYLNDRIKHYLSVLDIQIDVEFDNSLGVKTDRWGYEFCSGGERKRIDLAIMFGLYDLYVSIYGQQCNIMVLDEVDSRLDGSGVNLFANIVNDVCSNRDLSVFIISHKDELRSFFSNQIIIEKVNGFSKIGTII